jgi:hypothetical protein
MTIDREFVFHAELRRDGRETTVAVSASGIGKREAVIDELRYVDTPTANEVERMLCEDVTRAVEQALTPLYREWWFAKHGGPG